MKSDEVIKRIKRLLSYLFVQYVERTTRVVIIIL